MSFGKILGTQVEKVKSLWGDTKQPNFVRKYYGTSTGK